MYPKFKVGDHVRISKHKNIFAKRYMSDWSEEVFAVSKIKDTFPWTCVISDLMAKTMVDIFMKKNCKKLVKNLE